MSEKLLIERLKSLAAEVHGPVKEALLDSAMALTEADALAARLAEAERDADRYRWLREENHAFDWDGFPWPKGFTWDDDVDMCVNLDRAIDIARAADSADEVKP